MKGDFTRATFTPEKHYHGVLKQQGRVDIDADWNEQGAIASHRVETETVDVIGPCGAPVGDGGFVITAVSGGTNLNISAGRAYVDGVLCENETDALITGQPDLPHFTLPTTAGVYIAYLEVWLRHIIGLDDESIREVALGGPDTCTRAKTVWQVGLLDVGESGAAVDCSTEVPSWDTLIAPSTGTLAARAEPDPTSDDICTIPAKAGYRRLENQLYRVEIHDSGDVEASGGSATFKWSRDNGSIVTTWTAHTGNDLTVTSVGRDSVLGFAAGQWVELIDDLHELNFQPGTLVQLANVQGLTLTINPATATGSVNFADFPVNPKIRRWDSAGAINLTTGSWLDLEGGVQAEFSFGTYATGDYWLIPARTLTGDVEWPLDTLSNPIPEPPKGIHRHLCRLAVVQFDGTAWSVIGPSCMPTFPPLTGLPTTGTGEDPGIHVLDVRTISPDGELLNDSNLPFTLLRPGIRVLCDAPIDPISVQAPTCFVTVDVPFPMDPVKLLFSNVVVGSQTIILPGRLLASGKEIRWALINPQTLGFLEHLLVALIESKIEGLDKRLLVRLTLKGSVIWGQEDPTLFLDGEAFGKARGTNIGLQLPQSGNGKRGGDFEMWFWLVLPIQPGLSFPPNGVIAGQDATGTLTLNLAAPTGGLEVALSGQALDANGNPMTANIGTVPASVAVPAGQSSATFTVTNTSLPVGVSFATLQVTASYFTSSAQGDLPISAPSAPVGIAGPGKVTPPKGRRAKKQKQVSANEQGMTLDRIAQTPLVSPAECR